MERELPVPARHRHHSPRILDRRRSMASGSANIDLPVVGLGRRDLAELFAHRHGALFIELFRY